MFNMLSISFPHRISIMQSVLFESFVDKNEEIKWLANLEVRWIDVNIMCSFVKKNYDAISIRNNILKEKRHKG